jgi:hypothetical protein
MSWEESEYLLKLGVRQAERGVLPRKRGFRLGRGIRLKER